MKEELLILLKEELEKIKIENNEHNQKVKRIKELQKDSKVKEYIKLISLFKNEELKQINLSDTQIISSLYNRYLHKIQKEDTNGIYIYLGTYEYNNEVDIIHGSNDFRVNYNSPKANYRIYKNIEYTYGESIPIEMCDEFEKEHIVIKPNTYFKNKIYYQIQEDFFIKAVKTNQESAKKMIIKKYNR